MSEPHQRLKEARENAGYGEAKDAAEAMGIPPQTYFAHENGSRGLARSAKRYADFFHVSLDWLISNKGTARPRPTRDEHVQAIGYVGAGAEIIPFDDHDAGMAEVEMPPGASKKLAPVIVRGTSMEPRYFDGETLYYLKDTHSPSELVGRECVIKLVDGRMFVKILRKGTKPGVFNLESWNAKLIRNQRIEWAALVRWRG